MALHQVEECCPLSEQNRLNRMPGPVSVPHCHVENMTRGHFSPTDHKHSPLTAVWPIGRAGGRNKDLLDGAAALVGEQDLVQLLRDGHGGGACLAVECDLAGAAEVLGRAFLAAGVFIDDEQVEGAVALAAEA